MRLVFMMHRLKVQSGFFAVRMIARILTYLFPRSMTFLTELATNASNHGVHIITYVGNDDAISPHFGTEGIVFWGTSGMQIYLTTIQLLYRYLRFEISPGTVS